MDDRTLSEWLRLREDADARARSLALTEAIATRVRVGRPISVVDLGAGAGSNLRYLAPRLPGPQRWLLVDRSARLLDDMIERTRAWAAARGCLVYGDRAQGVSITGEGIDLTIDTRTQDLELLDDPTLFAGRDLVTTSALLDLVSERWLQALASQCRAAGAAALCTITYDGRFMCDPVEPEDEHVRALMNAHQLRDKGLGGPAEGPRAATAAEHCFRAAGFHVATEQSDWLLGPGKGAMQRVLLEGWVEAALEIAPAEATALADWRTRRLAHLHAGRSRIVVGHRDLAAWRD
jgi:SAM-dependent methyltransferase